MTYTKEELYAEAKRRMEGFEYKLECGSDTAETWTCKHPNQSYYAFQLAVGRFGMAMFGDTGSLTFNVGTYYGIPFLQDQDKRYVYDKLDADSREKEFRDDYFRDCCVEWVTSALLYKHDGLLSDDELDWLTESEGMGGKRPTFEEMVTFVYDKYMAVGSDAVWYELQEFLSAATYVENVNSVQDLVERYEEVLGDVYLWDYTWERPSHSAMQKLWMLHVASENIMEIKNAA